jgi:recombination DNA repair RAD52 pathway protein
MPFIPEQKAWLSAKLSPDGVRERKQAGRTLSYVEGWHVIKEANRIFGFDGWCRTTEEMRMVVETPRSIGRDQKKGWGVSYLAKVRVQVFGPVLPTIEQYDHGVIGTIVREGYGTGHGIDVDLGLAHESAMKEAETDAMKRAFITFGNPFGLALYDKEQAEVGYEEPAVEHDEHPNREDQLLGLLVGAAEISLRGSATLDELKLRWGRLPSNIKAMLGETKENMKVTLQERE